MANKAKKSTKKKAVKKPATAKKKAASKYKNPAERVEKDILNKTLKGVNVLLKASGKPELEALPAGIPGDTCNCPIAIALKPIGVTSVSGDRVEVKATVTEIRKVESAFAPLAKAEKPEVDVETINLLDRYDTDLPANIRNAMDSFETFVSQFDENEVERLAREKRIEELEKQRDAIEAEIDKLDVDRW